MIAGAAEAGLRGDLKAMEVIPKAAIAQLSALAVGGLRFCPGVTLEAAHRVRIDGDKSVPVQIDGEVLGQLPLDITIHPKQLAIILP